MRPALACAVCVAAVLGWAVAQEEACPSTCARVCEGECAILTRKATESWCSSPVRTDAVCCCPEESCDCCCEADPVQLLVLVLGFLFVLVVVVSYCYVTPWCLVYKAFNPNYGKSFARQSARARKRRRRRRVAA